jgi:adenosylcobinamide hydrolase
MFEFARSDGVLQFARTGTHWLATGPGGGFERADAAYNVTVPEGWDRTDPEVYAAERVEAAGFEPGGPALLTGVEQRHARGAQVDSVAVVATVGLSNPTAFGPSHSEVDTGGDDTRRPGTVNLLVGTDRALADGTQAELLATVVEAKAATLQRATGFSGTTSDAVVVGCDPQGEPAAFTGSATAVGDAARTCVRAAVTASLESRYADCDVPNSVADADHGVVTTRNPDAFDPCG